MAKMRISPELKKLIEKYRCVKDTEGMSPAKVSGKNSMSSYFLTYWGSSLIGRK